MTIENAKWKNFIKVLSLYFAKLKTLLHRRIYACRQAGVSGGKVHPAPC
jgi:hypothetical protein